MARTINSPGVQVTEKDLSLRIQTPAGTSIVVPGFASQGPSSEPLTITTVSELESVYGIPSTAAERYFYYSCKEILNSPATLTTIRLPYGTGSGTGFANTYSGIFYPMALAGTTWTVGAPVHITLTQNEYKRILQGDFNWESAGGSNASVATVPNIDVAAGFFILNDLQTSVNEIGEGYYIGFADNSAVSNSSPNFESITTIHTLSSNGQFVTMDTALFDFALSATADQAVRGVASVSETLEKVGFVGFETQAYQDHISLGVFKLRKSTANASLLSLITTEKYLGSFDYNRKQVSPTGGILTNSYIEDSVNSSSPTIKLFINPAVAKDFKWTGNGSTLPEYKVVVGSAARALFPFGVYVPDGRLQNQTKIIGNVPLKLDKALRTIEGTEDYEVDVLIDAGLSNIYAVTEYKATSAYDDESYIADVSNIELGWKAVANELINFSENTRKDCFTIIDPPRSFFISGKDTKVAEIETNTFTSDIYNPLKSAVGTLETNYAAIYGNWVKIQDLFSGRRVWLPFSGYAASIFAKSDAAANTWAAPAGMNRGTFNALDIAFNPNQKQRDRLYEIAVNPVVYFNGDGFSIMGQKTLQNKPTAFDRINVRRLFLTLERAVQRTLKYFVFEPNTDFTRTRLKNVISPIFDYAKNTEGLYDFLIVADDRNNTPDTIDNNELIVDIYLKPVRTAEFILVNFIATRTGQAFQELL